jgi:hypothetical protein
MDKHARESAMVLTAQASALCKLAGWKLAGAAHALHDAGMTPQEVAITSPIWNLPGDSLEQLGTELDRLAYWLWRNIER